MPAIMTMLADHAARQLLDFSQKLDINLLDNVVNCLYHGEGAQQRMAQEVLTHLKEHPDAWTRVDTILEFSQNMNTKMIRGTERKQQYYGLQILENVIKTRWKILPRNQCEGIKKYVVGLIIKTSSDPTCVEKEKVYIGKLNMILVQILKQEWPKHWPTFISDIVGASRTSESLCQNNMVILKLLSEEVFDFSSGQITQVKAKHLKDSMCNEFSQIFQLCQFVMENSQNAPLVHATLETLLRFLNWIPLGYIFETKLISTLIYKFLNVPMFRNVSLKCLTEIAGVIVGQYEEQFVTLFTLTMMQLKQMLPLNTNIRLAYSNGKDDEQNFIQNLSLFLCTFLKEHGQLIEKRLNLRETLMEALHYMLLVSEVEETEIFKICLEYWNHLAAELYRESPFSAILSPLISGTQHFDVPPRRQMYLPVLSKPQQVHTFYEAVGYMISAQMDQTVQEHLIEKYMLLPNQVWDSIIQQATKNVDILKDPETVKQLGSILKTNVRACKAVGHPFVIQLGRIYLDMLNVYKCLSENISAAIQANGEMVTKQPLIRSMRTVKRETLKLISGWVSRSTDPQMVAENFVPPLLDAVLIDYQRNVPAAREPEVLSTMAIIVNKLGGHITAEIPQIFDAVFECTLNMINKDFEEYPEHRTNFFLLLQAVNSHCFPAFLAIPPAQFKLVLDSIIWAFKHTMRNVADTGLQILFTLLQNVAQEEAAAQSFYQTYFCDILQHIFSVVTDTSHTAGLTMHASILAYMFNLVEEGKISTPLNPGNPVNNQMFIQEFVANLLKSAFPHLQDAQVKLFVTGLFSLNQDIPPFKEHLRDFLVQIKEFAGEDTSDLFLEERETALRQAQEEKHKCQISVPGILNPHEIPEEMCD
ncbi:exportin-1 isoform X7 [Molossus molossus]|uniref:exportin-1 isoform X7 n=1 Tax=Molossus molossus TaxID=27622 RepID=UPI001746D418|nr:exportin-1 isoform X7 [Molossus molossus]